MKGKATHAEAIDLWVQAFERRFGFKYVFKGAADGKAMRKLLASGLSPAEIISLAERAWAAPQLPKYWNCKCRAGSLCAFASAINEIRTELATLQPAASGAF